MCRRRTWRLAGVALVAVGQRDRLPGRFLHGGGPFCDLRPVLRVGRGDVQCEEVPEGIDGEIDLAALAPFGPVPTGPIAAFGRALQGAAVEDHGAGLRRVPLAEADQRAHVGDDHLEARRIDPAAGLLVDGGSWREIGRHEAPLQTGAGDVTQTVEQFAQGMFLRWGTSSRIRVR